MTGVLSQKITLETRPPKLLPLSVENPMPFLEFGAQAARNLPHFCNYKVPGKHP